MGSIGLQVLILREKNILVNWVKSGNQILDTLCRLTFVLFCIRHYQSICYLELKPQYPVKRRFTPLRGYVVSLLFMLYMLSSGHFPFLCLHGYSWVAPLLTSWAVRESQHRDKELQILPRAGSLLLCCHEPYNISQNDGLWWREQPSRVSPPSNL